MNPRYRHKKQQPTRRPAGRETQWGQVMGTLELSEMVENITRDQVKLEKDQRKAEEILHSNINEEKISEHDNNMKEF